MNCKECKYGNHNKKTDTVLCRLLDRTLIVDRAEKCKEYELKNEVKRYQEWMKAREEV